MSSSSLFSCSTGSSAGLAPQNSRGINPALVQPLANDGAVAHQTAGFDEFAPFVDRWHRVASGKRDKLNLPAGKQRIGAEDQRICLLLDYLVERPFKIRIWRRTRQEKPEPERDCGGLGIARLMRRRRPLRIAAARARA